MKGATHGVVVTVSNGDFGGRFFEMIDELEAEEEARIELADMARDGWR